AYASQVSSTLIQGDSHVIGAGKSQAVLSKVWNKVVDAVDSVSDNTGLKR
ncbi:MAG: hypothetical protein FJZ00_01300, partial [Candidatus Sericytochromatia bacterium]|nr:hypothetical protein [Candidatus Tanganyikabacteria bacterium]